MSLSPPVAGALDAAVPALLRTIQTQFYRTRPPADFHRDRHRLLYALTWPAVWLERRGLTCSAARYRQLLVERFDAIVTHGDPQRYGAYFPAYLLKCLQDWFQHHGDELYAELKHIRNALDLVFASVRFAASAPADTRYLEVLVHTHRLLHVKISRRSSVADEHAGQLTLF